jgi:hypothetical protein
MQTSGKFVTVLIFSLMAFNASAQFTLTGEFRPRTEYRHGFSTLIADNEDPAFFTSQRTRLNFRYGMDELIFFVSLQDIRVWGEVPQLNRSDANSSIHEAWAELRLNTEWSLRLGRQELVYDNARILGNVDWAQQGRSHDLALLKWKGTGGSQFHAGFAFNQDSERRVFTTYTINNYKTMQFLWYNYKTDNTALSLLFLNNGIQHSVDKTVFSQTTGGRITQKLGQVDLAGSAYLQTGRDGADRKLSAFYLAAEGGYSFSEKFKGAFGFEYLSGTDYLNINNNAATNRSFTPLFGTNHAFNGHMDYFYVGNHLNHVGLINPYLATQYTKNKFLFMGHLHLFFADGALPPYVVPSENRGSYLGTEVDLIAGYTFSPSTSIRFGYSQMFPSDKLEFVKGVNTSKANNWAWVMLILKPNLFPN